MTPGERVQALLATPSSARTPHFSLHVTPIEVVAQELPTEAAPDRTESVDNMTLLVVPKRYAKRSVTRNLIKRQMREAARRYRGGKPVVQLLRLRSAFEPRHFPSAASPALRIAVREELDALFSSARPRPHAGAGA